MSKDDWRIFDRRNAFTRVAARIGEISTNCHIAVKYKCPSMGNYIWIDTPIFHMYNWLYRLPHLTFEDSPVISPELYAIEITVFG